MDIYTRHIGLMLVIVSNIIIHYSLASPLVIKPRQVFGEVTEEPTTTTDEVTVVTSTTQLHQGPIGSEDIIESTTTLSEITTVIADKFTNSTDIFVPGDGSNSSSSVPGSVPTQDKDVVTPQEPNSSESDSDEDSSDEDSSSSDETSPCGHHHDSGESSDTENSSSEDSDSWEWGWDSSSSESSNSNESYEFYFYFEYGDKKE